MLILLQNFQFQVKLVGLRNINTAFNNTKNGYFDRFKLIGKKTAKRNKIIGVLRLWNM